MAMARKRGQQIKQQAAEVSEPLCSECREPMSKRNPKCEYCRVATAEENRAGLAALKAAITGKPGPMARELDRIMARLRVSTERPAETEVPF